MRYLLFLFIIVTAVSCTTTWANYTSMSRGECQQKRVDGLPIRICVDSVLTDSRCPLSVTCVHRGFVKARFLITFAEVPAVPIEIYMKDYGFAGRPTDTIMHGFRVQFNKLTPAPGEAGYSYENLKASVRVSKL